jgi:hypothetical protein
VGRKQETGRAELVPRGDRGGRGEKPAPENFALQPAARQETHRPVIDFSDVNVWGIFAMPVGVALCFGPAMLVWWLMEGRKQQQQKPEPARKNRH